MRRLGPVGVVATAAAASADEEPAGGGGGSKPVAAAGLSAEPPAVGSVVHLHQSSYSRPSLPSGYYKASRLKSRTLVVSVEEVDETTNSSWTGYVVGGRQGAKVWSPVSVCEFYIIPRVMAVGMTTVPRRRASLSGGNSQ